MQIKVILQQSGNALRIFRGHLKAATLLNNGGENIWPWMKISQKHPILLVAAELGGILSFLCLESVGGVSPCSLSLKSY